MKNWPEGASSMAPPPPLEKHWGGGLSPPPPPTPPGFDAYEFLKTPSHRLVRSQYCGIVWAKEEGSWRDLEICVSPKVEGADTPFRPLPGKWGAGAPLAPPPVPMPT